MGQPGPFPRSVDFPANRCGKIWALARHKWRGKNGEPKSNPLLDQLGFSFPIQKKLGQQWVYGGVVLGEMAREERPDAVSCVSRFLVLVSCPYDDTECPHW